MDDPSCRTCAHYRQHDTFNQHKIFSVYCGHCTYRKVKTKKPDAKACEHYLFAESVENAFVTKEYLRKSLPEYILKQELLPEIYEAEEL